MCDRRIDQTCLGQTFDEEKKLQTVFIDFIQIVNTCKRKPNKLQVNLRRKFYNSPI